MSPLLGHRALEFDEDGLCCDSTMTRKVLSHVNGIGLEKEPQCNAYHNYKLQDGLRISFH